MTDLSNEGALRKVLREAAITMYRDKNPAAVIPERFNTQQPHTYEHVRQALKVLPDMIHSALRRWPDDQVLICDAIRIKPKLLKEFDVHTVEMHLAAIESGDEECISYMINPSVDTVCFAYDKMQSWSMIGYIQDDELITEVTKRIIDKHVGEHEESRSPFTTLVVMWFIENIGSYKFGKGRKIPVGLVNQYYDVVMPFPEVLEKMLEIDGISATAKVYLLFKLGGR